MKILYFDTETTGRDPIKNGLIQLSGIIEVDGRVEEEFNFKVAPFETDEIDDEALKVNGITREQLKSFTSPRKTFVLIEQLFNRYIQRFDKTDKFYPAGYNVRFDIDFLNQFFKKNFNDYFGSYCNWRSIDAFPLVHYLNYRGYFSLSNYKLSTICDYFEIKIQAHDAMSDIRATRELLLKLREIIKIKK